MFLNSLQNFKFIWGQFLMWFNRPMCDEILLFRRDYEQLIGRYEMLLKQISVYMKEHSFILKEESKETHEILDQLNSVDSFLLQTIRDDLKRITDECELLLAMGEKKPVDFPYQQEILNMHITQLKELRKYSEQIDSTLSNFEEKVMRVEEILSKHSLAN